MRLFGKRIPLSVSLLFWFAVWEVVGRVGVSSIFPPLSRIVTAGLTILPTREVHQGGGDLAAFVRGGHGGWR